MRNEELIVIFGREDYVFGDAADEEQRTVICSVRTMSGERHVARGKAGEGALIPGVTYRLFGHWSNHAKYGRQFAFNSFTEEAPADRESVVAYLMQCRESGRGSVSERVAGELVKKYGLEAIDRLINNPAEAAEGIKMWDANKAGIAAGILKQSRGTQRAKMQLIQLLNGRGMPKRTPDRAIKRWGTGAAGMIRENPFLLCSLRGVGFKLADRMFCELTAEDYPDPQERAQRLAAPIRQQAALWDAVSKQTRSTGSTWHRAQWAAGVLRGLIGQGVSYEDTARQCEQEGMLVTVTNSEGQWIALPSCALHEADIAKFASDAVEARQQNLWPTVDQILRYAPEGRPLSQHQLDALQIALSNRVGCLQGSPGVGKTFSVACVVKAIVEAHGIDSVAIAAPTGKAAVRVGQSLLANGVEIGASTIHRLLQVGMAGEDGSWGFIHGKRNPLPYKFLVVDESSMIDTDLMASLLAACTREMHILLVGDSNQLAPVGHGRPFLDLQSIVPTGYLTEIRRNSGRIVQCCAEIRDHRRFSVSDTLAPETGDNLILIQTDDAEASRRVETAIERLVNRFHIHPIDQLQVLCGKNTTRTALNKILQAKLNPDGHSVKGNPFRLGDKAVCIKNGSYPDPEDRLTKHFVANGELGTVTDIKPGRMLISLQDPPRLIVVAYAAQAEDSSPGESGGDDNGDSQRGAVGDWDLGYCLSVHRSQGSQWPFVILLAERAAAMVQSRNWVYTGISRAERATIVIGQRQTLDASMRRDGISDRVTHLVQLAGVEVTRRIDVDQLFGVL